MDFVQIGHGAVLLGQGDGAGDVGDVAVHRIDALEGDQLGRINRRGGQQFFEVFKVVVAEDVARTAAVTDALDHRGVVQGVGEDDQARQDLLQGRQRRLIGHIARGEQQGRFLLVPAGQLGFQIDRRTGGAGNVARTAGAGAHGVDLGLHGVQHQGMLAHAQIVVGAPDHDVLFGAVLATAHRLRKLSAHALQIGEDAIAAFAADLLDRVLKGGLIVEQGASSFAYTAFRA
ncbi:hypothetical protein D3C81_1421750 [compost metagenome]